MNTEQLQQAIEQWKREDFDHRAMMIFIGEFDEHGNAAGGPIVMSAKTEALLRHPNVAEIVISCAETAEKLRKSAKIGDADTCIQTNTQTHTKL